MKIIKTTILSVLLSFSLYTNAQDVEIVGELRMSGNIQLGQLGSFEGSIDGLDVLTGKNDLRFRIEGVSEDIIHINANARVGIGADATNSKFDVFGGTEILSAYFTSTNTVGTTIAIENTFGNQWHLTSTGSTSGNGSGGLEFFNANMGHSTYLTTAAGNTAIGLFSSVPNDALDVTGDIDATGCFQNNDTGTIGGTCISDRRFKKNISTLDNQLSNILSLRPVRFDWKININHGMEGDIGLIAQEVVNVLPEMVVTDDSGYKKVRYDISLQMRVIKAIQEQQEIIDTQNSTINAQQKQIDFLKEELSILKELILAKEK